MDDSEPTPIFLTLEEVLEIHRDQIERYGGDPGVLNLGSLESAIAQPQASHGGQLLHGDVFEMAAVYLFNISQNHPFVDGNKRVAAVSAIIFLNLNGYRLDVSNDELESMVLAVASGKMKREEVARFYRENCG